MLIFQTKNMRSTTGVSQKRTIHVTVPVEAVDKKTKVFENLHRKKKQLFIKRSFDIAVSLSLLTLLSPLLLLVAFIIKITSRGKVLYSNERVGMGAKHFRCYKFRSMISDQSKRSQAYRMALEQSQQGVLLKLQNDPRVTWIGKVIRKSSIDELPQLFNVLLGDMSIIGPRPLVPFMLTHLPDFKEVRCKVRPGITGLWQIRDRKNNTSAEFMIEHDTEYVRDYSLIMDFKILLSTPKAVLKAEGAY